MKCQICDSHISPIDLNLAFCAACKQLNRSDFFSKILAVLLDIQFANKEFETIKDKCIQVDGIIRSFPLFITPLSTFDPEIHDTDRIALHYLRNYVISEDDNTFQNYYPIKIDEPNFDYLYKTIAILCRLDIIDGAKELRVRNIVDLILNADLYQSIDPELHSCMQWGETWKYFVLEQLHEKQSMNSPNAVFTLILHSLSNVINIRIRSIYPKIPGTNDDLRKRLNRIFSPLIFQSNEIINILWSHKNHISSHSISSVWLPDCVIPLLLKPDSNSNNTTNLPRPISTTLRSPANRNFYILSCFCLITQTSLNEIVSASDQQKHSEAEIKKENYKLKEFRCPKCFKICNDYHFDWNAVALFRQNFTGARLTYILVDITSSMSFNLLQITKTDEKSSLPRIVQTKEAVKQLLKEISAGASLLDQAILTTFDDKLQKPAVIPLCKAMDIAEEANLARIDAIELSHRSVKTCFYLVLKELYEMLEREPFLYVDLYLFSDGVDTSSKKHDKTYQAIIRGLNEKIGAKCHFMNCGSAAQGFSVAAWLGDAEADYAISGNIDEIKTQIKAVYKKNHVKNSRLTSSRVRAETFDSSQSSSNDYMTDDEVASIHKPTSSRLSFVENSNPNVTDLDDYLYTLHSTSRARASTATIHNRSNSPDMYKAVTRNSNIHKPK